MSQDWIVVEARTSGLGAEIYLNDIPVLRLPPGWLEPVSVPVNQFVTKGPNRFEMVVRPGPSPGQAREPYPEPERALGATAHATLSKYREKTVSGDGSGELLGTLTWVARGDNEPEPFPASVSADPTVPMDLGPWAWQSAEVLTLDEQVTAEVGRLIDQIRGSLAAGDTQPFLELGAMSLREIARAYRDSPETGVTTLRALVDHSRSAPHWKFPPIPADRWDLRLVAQGRMIDCVGKDWEPLVRSVTDQELNSFSMPMMVGKVGGRWSVLR